MANELISSTKLPFLKKSAYGNCVMLSPEGTPLCRCNRKKVDWYLSRDLADVVVEDDPFTIKLKFNPKGNGNAGSPYYLASKKNACVVCSRTDFLTKHHVVPRCFRKFFPSRYKDHCSHDIVLMCVRCHNEYEREADQLKIELAEKYGIKFPPPWERDVDLQRAAKLARTLQRYGHRIPRARSDQLRQELDELLVKYAITEEEAAAWYPSDDTEDHFGRLVVERVEQIGDFCRMWREHFVVTTQPEYLPAHWHVDYRPEWETDE